jgi:hypothetical protein
MPADFDDIASYHFRQAAHFRALAQDARDLGSRNEAEYLASQAVRYAEAAEEQRCAMTQEPGPAKANRMSHHPWPPPEPESSPSAATGIFAVPRGIHHSASKRNEPFHGLSLH